MLVRPFLNTLTVVMLVLVFLAFPYAAIETYGPNARAPVGMLND